MKLFFIKASVFSAIGIAIFVLISLTYNVDSSRANSYMSVIADKHERLDSVLDNRLLLVGGSNLCFGMSSRTIHERLGVNPVNLGLHAGLGKDFIINEALPGIRRGDIVLLILEYELWNPNYRPNEALIERVQHAYPKAKEFYSFSWSERLNLTYAHFRKAFDFSRPASDPIYALSSFDKFGDVVVDRPAADKPQKIQGGLSMVETLGDISIYKKLNDRCAQAGAQLIMMYPNYPKRLYESERRQITALDAAIRRELPFITIIGTPETFLVDDSRLFDTAYHLTPEGVNERTERMISLLKNSIFAVPNQTK